MFFSAAGVFAGSKLGCVLGTKMEIIGGVILVLIGCKFLLVKPVCSDVREVSHG